LEQVLGLVVVLFAGGVGFVLTRWKLRFLFQGLVLAVMAACWLFVIFAGPNYLYKFWGARFSGDLRTALRVMASMTFFAIPAAFVGWLGGIWLCLWERKDKAHGRSPQK
jgi:hypothetical protein